jgi:ferric-dicitrate binding protein FerR (iron transport regulator)
VALDLRENSDAPLQERLLEEDPREAEHQRRLEEERQAHLQAMELLRLKNSLALKRQNTPSELIKTRAQATLAIGMAVLALGTLCYLLIRSDTPMDLKKDILKYVGGAIGGVGVGYAIGKGAKAEAED